jgi:multiple sugar transport system permease protein
MAVVADKIEAEEQPQERPKTVRRKLNMFQEMRKHWADYVYVLPALGAMLLVIGYPIYYTINLSFHLTSPALAMSENVWIGLDNYRTILRNADFRNATENTFIWTIFSTFFAFIIGLGAALVLNREFIGRGFLRGVLLIPYVISAVAASYIWRWILHSDFGVIGAATTRLGLTDGPINFLDNVDRVLYTLIAVNVWKEFSFAMIMMLAGLQTVPDQLHRAAMVDGASTWNRFWHVTMPHLKGVTLVTVLLLLVTNLNSFTIPWVMTGGGPANASEIWITHIYEIAFGRVRFGIASAYSVILFLVMMSMGYFYVRALTRGDEKRAG